MKLFLKNKLIITKNPEMVKETSFLIQEVETAPAMEYFDVNQGTISTILGTNRPTSVPRGL